MSTFRRKRFWPCSKSTSRRQSTGGAPGSPLLRERPHRPCSATAAERKRPGEVVVAPPRGDRGRVRPGGRARDRRVERRRGDETGDPERARLGIRTERRIKVPLRLLDARRNTEVAPAERVDRRHTANGDVDQGSERDAEDSRVTARSLVAVAATNGAGRDRDSRTGRDDASGDRESGAGNPARRCRDVMDRSRSADASLIAALLVPRGEASR